MEDRKKPKPQELYRHFKNKLYQIITIAEDSETKEELVIYQALYGEYKMYARSLSMFFSLVDSEKYPNSTQKYRFEKVNSIGSVNNQKITEVNANDVIDEEDLEAQCVDELPNADLISFLEAETFEERRNALVHMKPRITNRLINDIAASLDVTVDEGDLDTRYKSLLTCVETLGKYEISRF